MTTNKPSTSARPAPIFIGYSRVSRPGQDIGHHSLEAQKLSIRSYCREHGQNSTTVFRDVFTGRDSASKRPGLYEAINECNRTGATLVVASIDRLGRSLDVAKLLEDRDVEVVSIAEGRVSAEGRLVPLLVKAEDYSKAISSNAKETNRKKRAAGAILGNLKNLEEHRAKGARNNKARAEDKARGIAVALLAFPDLKVMTLKEKVSFLNRLGVMNRRSLHGMPVEWSKGSLRKPLKAALAWIALQGLTGGDGLSRPSQPLSNDPGMQV